MKYCYVIKNLISVFLLTSLFCANHAGAEFLTFKTGDKASYTISQKLTAECKIFDETTYIQSDAIIDLDIEILSANQETSSYPFDVEVKLKKIIISETQQDGQSSTITKYDSNDLRTLGNYLLAEQLDQLINYPLNFRVEKEFQIKEMTGHLAQIYENIDSPSVGIFGATPWTFELLLTQLFHLSGENLLLTNSHPVSCYQFSNWEDEALDEQEIKLDQSSTYVINNNTSKEMKASWQGNAKVFSSADDINGEVSLIGNVKWDIANPLIQTRDLEVKIEAKCEGIFPAYYKILVQQAWLPTSL